MVKVKITESKDVAEKGIHVHHLKRGQELEFSKEFAERLEEIGVANIIGGKKKDGKKGSYLG